MVSDYHFEYPNKESKNEMRSIYSAQNIPWENNERKNILLIDMPRIADDAEATWKNGNYFFGNDE